MDLIIPERKDKTKRLLHFEAAPFLLHSTAAAGEKKYSDDNEPDNAVVVKNVAKAVIHNRTSKNF